MSIAKHWVRLFISLCCVGPPMIIYAKSFPRGQYRFQEPDDALYAKSDSGRIDSELFLTWLKKYFFKYAVPQRPVLLAISLILLWML